MCSGERVPRDSSLLERDRCSPTERAIAFRAPARETGAETWGKESRGAFAEWFSATAARPDVFTPRAGIITNNHPGGQ